MVSPGQLPQPVLAPFRIAPRFVGRVWGSLDLHPWYDRTAEGGGEPIGEVWLTGDECVVATGQHAGQTLGEVFREASQALLGANAPSAESPLLIKVIFAKQKLSVQVHPDDRMARKYGQPRGKTECWYALSAEPGAEVAAGLKPGVTLDQIKAGIHDGTLEESLNLLPISAGDMVFVDAGTVHAIGPGVVLLETQQTCDVTFRMYDYGRPRELHVEQALKVMKLKTAAGKVRPVAMDRFTRLIEQKYFVVDRYDVAAGGEVVVPTQGPGCLVGLTGGGTVFGGAEGQVELLPGKAVVIPSDCPSIVFKAEVGASFVKCWAP